MSSLKVNVGQLNEFLICPLCNGYFREAHTIPECLHSFCKVCILKNFNENNVKGHVSCPTCKTNLGIYAVNKQLIYDRNLQAMLDEIFPHFGESERAEEAQFNAALKAQVIAERLTYKRAYNENENEEPDPPAKMQKTEDAEVSFKLAPVANVNTSKPMLPVLKRPTFKSDLKIKASKVQKFVHKRILEEVPNLTPEDIEILNEKGTVMDPGSDLTTLETTEKDCNAVKLYSLYYRLKDSETTSSSTSTH